MDTDGNSASMWHWVQAGGEKDICGRNNTNWHHHCQSATITAASFDICFHRLPPQAMPGTQPDIGLESLLIRPNDPAPRRDFPSANLRGNFAKTKRSAAVFRWCGTFALLPVLASCAGSGSQDVEETVSSKSAGLIVKFKLKKPCRWKVAGPG